MVEVKEYKIVYYTHIRATHKRASSKPPTRNKKRTTTAKRITRSP
jgi:hypothetical protein